MLPHPPVFYLLNLINNLTFQMYEKKQRMVFPVAGGHKTKH